jgi:replicative DNA helicase
LNIEQQILSQVVHTEAYARAVLPHLKEEYFADKSAKLLFEIIRKYTAEFTTIPSIAALQIEIDRAEGMDEDTHQAAVMFVDEIKPREPLDIEHFLKRTEEYCQERAVDLALREAIMVQNDPKRAKGEIQSIFQEALQVTFDSRIGHSYFDDAEARYDYFHSDVLKLPFDLDTLNRATNGGVERKSLNILMAGCVHPDTLVQIYYAYHGVEKRKIVTMAKLKQLMDEGIAVKVFSPDGYVHVNEFVDKGMYEEYVITTENGEMLRCNAGHMVKTYYGWESAENLAKIYLAKVEAVNIMTRKGPSPAIVKKTGMMIPIVDLEIDHPNHRYYANNIESHNTNVGKTLIMCHFAAADVLAGKKVLYVTAEESQEKISRRIDSNLLNVGLDKYEAMPKDWFLGKLKEIKKKCAGDIVVREYASNSAHAGHIRHLLQELKVKKGFVPDVIYVDYINIMASQRYRPGQVPKHEYIKSIAEELRAIGQTENVPVFSATQTNREGFKSSDADITDVSEAWGLPATADWFLIIIQPDDLVELGQYLCKQEKSRYSNKDYMRKFMLGVDKDKQKLFDLDRQPNLSGGQYEADIPAFDQGAIAEAEGFSQFRS